jgi:4-alpha-glucanotransferase
VGKRSWGVFAPLYALRADRTKPVGDLADLEQLMTWASVQGASVVSTLPMSASFLTLPFDPSPYSPASRLYWNELYLDLDRLLANSDCIPARNRACAGEWQHEKRIAAEGEYVDYRSIAQLKRHVLEALADWFFLQHRELSEDFLRFLALYPDAPQYASFRAAAERQGRGWPAWPPRLAQGELQSHDYDDDAARYHLYAQFAMHEQLEALAQRARAEKTALYLDMPLGVHPDSFDVWSNQALFVTGASAGAPPDAFFTKGQNWGFPPMNPRVLRGQGYQYLRRVLQTQLRYAGMLRIDHVMSLHRLFFVPAGYEATDGVYVSYPHDEMYAVLTIESQRHGSAIVGEDLGTVPAEVRKSMKRHGVKRMFVVQFEAGADNPPIGTPPAEAVASLNTHDMPPFAAFWGALDADMRREMGLLDDDDASAQRGHRAEVARALSAHLRRNGVLDDGAVDRLLHRKAEPDEAVAALLEMLARSPADLALVNLEDLWLEEQPQNVPGTSAEKPNWRRRMRYTLDEMRNQTELTETLRRINAARHAVDKDGTE